MIKKEYNEMTYEELQEVLSNALENSTKISKENQAEFDSIKNMVKSAIDRGAPIKWADEAVKDLLAFHNAEQALSELREVYELMIAQWERK